MTTDAQWTLPIDDEIASGGPKWLEGKVAVVAGGGLSGPLGNVGFGAAWLYAKSGANIAVLDRDAAAAQRTVEAVQGLGVEAQAFDVDVTNEASVSSALDAVAERFGRIDVLATTIGGGGISPIVETTLEEWYRAMDVNLTQAMLLIKHVSRHMSRGGSIVTVSSSAAEGRGPAMAYSVAKTALEKLSIGAASSLAPQGIRVNCVRVGMIWGAFAARGMTEEMREIRRKNVALQTEGSPWDIASAMYFLSTDQARWISGQVLAVDGGGFAMSRNSGAAGSQTHLESKKQ